MRGGAGRFRIPRWLPGLAALLAGLGGAPAPAPPGYVWIEGEKPAVDRMNHHPWWYDQVRREEFSGGDFTSRGVGDVFKLENIVDKKVVFVHPYSRRRVAGGRRGPSRPSL